MDIVCTLNIYRRSKWSFAFNYFIVFFIFVAELFFLSIHLMAALFSCPLYLVVLANLYFILISCQPYELSLPNERL